MQLNKFYYLCNKLVFLKQCKKFDSRMNNISKTNFSSPLQQISRKWQDSKNYIYATIIDKDGCTFVRWSIL